ncbi:hypothetical protein BTO30_03815 [Domibacillus antri]|uniref:Glycoside-hydrolase family GH114 TIM-barrel domain-containing protein n=1 Tax=Domibacillus antri TaxID=1714264 RepID=A0A1Q8Q8D9_9BACI|nr:endo alpha-1,4 polygalactosaminidase [Domibacillus antri]OLN23561.1 hypothetical protein BTO30_03815 [Domibacillus antri]
MRKRLVWIILIVLVFFLGKGLLNMFWFGPLHDVKSFHIFYGTPDEEKLTELSGQDAAVIESLAFSEQDVAYLKENGVKLFGYVSLMQLENWNEELKERIAESDYAESGGNRIYIKEWDTYVMDLREPNYRDALLWKVEKYVTQRGLDGVFFDTVDDLDYYFRDEPAVEQAMRNGYAALLDELKKRHPDLIVIQNRGFETYETLSRSYVDGVLWEGFDAQDIKESEWAQKWLKYFKKEQRLGRVRVLTVVTDEKSRQLSEKNKFPAYVRKGDTYQ